MSSVNEYFSGEKTQCWIGIVLGVISIGLALYFLLHLKTDLYKGVAYPFLIIPVLLIMICAGVVWRTPHDIERVTNFIQQVPEKIATEEIPRMQRVLKSFKVIKIVEAVLFVAGLALVAYGATKGSDVAKGVGIGIAIQSAMMYAFDYFAHERGKAYWEFLQSL